VITHTRNPYLNDNNTTKSLNPTTAVLYLPLSYTCKWTDNRLARLDCLLTVV
jgi:hypothetical protein